MSCFYNLFDKFPIQPKVNMYIIMNCNKNTERKICLRNINFMMIWHSVPCSHCLPVHINRHHVKKVMNMTWHERYNTGEYGPL